MPQALLSVRELQPEDIDLIVRYWLESDAGHLTGMGVDLEKLPKREELQQMLREQIQAPLPEKKSYCVIWEANGEAIGHCNVNKIVFGEEASMHLHLWKGIHRQQGMGTALIRMTLPFFFENLDLKKIYSEPYALNPAPNKALEKAGFNLVKTYRTIPGSLNFEQEVNRWEMNRELIFD